MEKEWRIKELSLKFGVTPQLIGHYLRTGKLKGYKLGGNWRIPDSSILEFLVESNKKYMEEGN